MEAHPPAAAEVVAEAWGLRHMWALPDIQREEGVLPVSSQSPFSRAAGQTNSSFPRQAALVARQAVLGWDHTLKETQ